MRTPSSGSKYDYKMYAIVHSKLASHCSRPLAALGYEVLLRDVPVNVSDIRGEYLRRTVHREYCCGADEFLKLYAYTITDHPIVVHTDIDFMYHRPMDDLYDAMLLSVESEDGISARSRIEMEYPNDDPRVENVMPTNIEAYLTRDYHQVIPGRKAGACWEMILRTVRSPTFSCPSRLLFSDVPSDLKSLIALYCLSTLHLFPRPTAAIRSLPGGFSGPET